MTQRRQPNTRTRDYYTYDDGILINTTIDTNQYILCNFDENGNYDGYYSELIFNLNNGPHRHSNRNRTIIMRRRFILSLSILLTSLILSSCDSDTIETITYEPVGKAPDIEMEQNTFAFSHDGGDSVVKSIDGFKFHIDMLYDNINGSLVGPTFDSDKRPVSIAGDGIEIRTIDESSAQIHVVPSTSCHEWSLYISNLNRGALIKIIQK